ncbi:MAG TPA: hypothetical protein VGO06_27950 [Bosea sp. (in: a-proteobacteria)]|jgi:hypothetical protein|uniref:hypothetical protein n=1 Tax=Bosea sp. (in: a-proteobacteria) TaxID=1871050 RepID=UPI002E16558A|nr:hypothetical protein [Bosea sp. (in: a-proteobacteria)]
MTVEIEITGINLAPRPNWDRPLAIAAFCDVRLRGLSTTLLGVALGWSKGKWIAMPPKAIGARPNDPGVIKWDISGPVPQAIAEAMLKRYIAFGGPMPQPANEPAERETVIAAAKAGMIERRVFPFTLHSVDGKPIDAWSDGIDAELARMPVNQLDDYEPEDESGVLRTLRVEAEICDRAGL